MSTTMNDAMTEFARGGPRLRDGAESFEPYAPAAAGPFIDLYLDANEGPDWRDDPALDDDGDGPTSERARRYPSAAELERRIASDLGVDASCVLLTAGGDDAIDRLCRVTLQPGRTLLYPSPSFEMIRRSALLAGAAVETVDWPIGGGFPASEVIGRVKPSVGLISMVSPNNPTGAVIEAEELARVARAAERTTLLVDLAYAEFAEEDLTRAALSLPNAVVVRTFSKAWSMAGLRVGYAAGPAAIIRAMRAAGSPFPCAGPSIATVSRRYLSGIGRVRAVVERVKAERELLTRRLRELGAEATPSQANFVLARFERAELVWRMLGSLGVAVRRFESERLASWLRITCPGDERQFRRLLRALECVLKPGALLFDMDGVLADTSRSYRRAIIETAAGFGVRVSEEELAAQVRAGDANNDWITTRRLLAARGVDVSLEAVTERFERLYQGAAGAPGLRETETLLIGPEVLRRLAERRPLAVVTGRPRADAEHFLRRFGIAEVFTTMVCMGETERKPSPAPVQRVLRTLGVSGAWMIGDTPDDVRAARAAGVVPLGVVAPGEAEDGRAREAMKACGAAMVANDAAELVSVLEAAR
ncbi:MAG: aminotransferase class I/II-fold pyridoxal phosphate-dependent enzyme [Planctomycetota bacterium]|nr:aminotransferase class I/II-fold pyridoxal phosphate-dependent enzyme [Planctomycetota bacterium]